MGGGWWELSHGEKKATERGKGRKVQEMDEVTVLEAEIEWGEKAEIRGRLAALGLTLPWQRGGSLGQGSGNMQTSLETETI